MFGSKTRIITDVFIVLCFVVAGYVFRDSIFRFVRQQEQRFFPCKNPIIYSIGEFDTRFGISRASFIADIQSAERIWETPVNRDLFQYSSSSKDADVIINLIYDYRQKATDSQEKVDTVITSDRAQLNMLDAQYRAERDAYEAKVRALNERIRKFTIEKDAYEARVAAVNKKGGASPSEFQELEQEKNKLQQDSEQLKVDQSNINVQKDRLNSTVNTLNDMIKKLNLNISTYNKIGGSVGESFREGEYVQDVSGTRINLYQFSDRKSLIRVMAHEFGHAIGLGHNQNPQAIMYEYNQSENQKLAPEDFADISAVCKIQK